MTVARSAGVFIGTDETTGVTVANNATTTGSEADILGNDTTEGHLGLFLKYTCTATAGSIDITLVRNRVTGQTYSAQQPLAASIVPINGTEKIFLGDFQCSRYMLAIVKNNAIGASLTNVTIGYEVMKES